MTTRVISLRGRIHEFGPRLEDAPEDVVYVGGRWTLGGWDLPRHPLANPFAYDTPTKKRDGTRAEVMAMYRAYLLERPELLELVPGLRGKTPACWCAPELCHGDVPAATSPSPRPPGRRRPAPPGEAVTQVSYVPPNGAMALACTNRQ
jgi:hypothetical protein